jgi:hypothetical protein
MCECVQMDAHAHIGNQKNSQGLQVKNSSCEVGGVAQVIEHLSSKHEVKFKPQ